MFKIARTQTHGDTSLVTDTTERNLMSACVPATRQTIHEAVTLNLIQMVNVIFIVDRRRLSV